MAIQIKIAGKSVVACVGDVVIFRSDDMMVSVYDDNDNTRNVAATMVGYHYGFPDGSVQVGETAILLYIKEGGGVILATLDGLKDETGFAKLTQIYSHKE